MEEKVMIGLKFLGSYLFQRFVSGIWGVRKELRQQNALLSNLRTDLECVTAEVHYLKEELRNCQLESGRRKFDGLRLSK